jgi:hypothetical protein
MSYRTHVTRYDCTRSHVEHCRYLYMGFRPGPTVIADTHRQIIHCVKRMWDAKHSVISTITYGTPRPQAYFHYRKEEEQGLQVTSKRLRRTVGQHEQHKHMRLTNESPSITGLMYLHPRRRDVRGITEEGKPHIFNMQVIECLVKRAVELVSLTKSVG